LLFSTLLLGATLQRLFSMFPDGWPGRALLVLRLVGGAVLIYDGVIGLIGQNRVDVLAHQSLAVAAGLFLVIGLWTPLTGTLIAIIEVCTASYGTDHLRSTILLAAIGAALAMLGPGVCSIDARLFGRKRIDIPNH
jgi:putative oxidoreductase